MNLSFGPKPELAENELAKLITAVDQSTECRLSAFAMVTHDRLGQDSLFFALEPEIVVMILSSIWEAEYRELLHAEQQASNMWRCVFAIARETRESRALLEGLGERW